MTDHDQYGLGRLEEFDERSRNVTRTAVRCRMAKQTSGPGGAPTPRTRGQHTGGVDVAKRTCTIDGCESPVEAWGWCNKHYKRWCRNGDPLGLCPRIGKAQRFIEQAVTYTGTDCLEWPFSKGTSGYGQVRFRGRPRPAHRVVLEIVTGERPDDMEAAHAPLICHNRACVNPNHLEWKTPAENTADKFVDGTRWSKLTEDQALKIYADSRLPREIAADYGITRQAVDAIKSGQSWAWLTGANDG